MGVYNELDMELKGLTPKTDLSRDYERRQKQIGDIRKAFAAAYANEHEDQLVGTFQAKTDSWEYSFPADSNFSEQYQILEAAANKGNKEAIELMYMVDFVRNYGKKKAAKSDDLLTGL